MLEAVIMLTVGDYITVQEIEDTLNGNGPRATVYMKDTKLIYDYTKESEAVHMATMLLNSSSIPAEDRVVVVLTMWPRHWTPHFQIFHHDGQDLYSAGFMIPIPSYIEFEFLGNETTLQCEAKITNATPEDKVLLTASARY